MEVKRYPKRVFVHGICTLIYILSIVPAVLFDILLETYHEIVFRLLQIPLIKRSKYIEIWDRAELQYLTLGEKLGCAYCGYINGLAHYFVAIAAETEKYWCGIKHKNKKLPYQSNYLNYGDENAYNQYGRPYLFRDVIKRWLKK
jgi:hypothetical protein